MLDELRKFRNDLSTKILFLIIILVSIAVSIAPIKSFSAIESVDSANIIKGRPAINILKVRYENIKGELSIHKINEVLSYYKSIPDTDTAYIESNIKYPGIISLLSDAYSTGDTSETQNLNKIEDANDFYDRNVIKIASILENSHNEYRTWEEDAIIEKAKSIDTPFIIDFSKQWVNAYKSLTVVFVFISLSGVLIGSRLFSYEKEKNMDIILSTLGKRKIQNIGRNKVLALLTFLSIELVISALIVSIIIFSTTGINAWLNQIQFAYFTSIYNLTFGGAYLLFIFMAWISLMAIGALVAAINSLVQKSYPSLVIGFIVVFSPLLAIRISSLPLSIRKFMSIQPINGFSTVRNLLSLQMFDFIFTKCLTTTAIIFCSFIIFIFCKSIAPKLFSLRIKNI
ncbi:MAG: hypothetical protein RIN55_05800 [Tissierellaceae bacterium]|nr:hypothetical protein [Tissierellaceae bacterium]